MVFFFNTLKKECKYWEKLLSVNNASVTLWDESVIECTWVYLKINDSEFLADTSTGLPPVLCDIW
jgi:hypothetical protein